MASISSDSKIAITQKQALTFAQAQTLLTGPKQSKVDALWESKYTVTYVLSKVFSLNGLIPFFFDFSKAKAADQKVQAQVKPFNEALTSLVNATAAKVNQSPRDSTAKNNDAHVAERQKLVQAEQKALKAFAAISFSIFASNVDMKDASRDTASKSQRAFALAVVTALRTNRGSLTQAQVVTPTEAMADKAAIKYFAKNVELATLQDPKAKREFTKTAAKLSGINSDNLVSGILRKQVEKNPEVLEAVEAGVKSLNKTVKFSKDEIKAEKDSRVEARSKLEDEIKTLKADVKTARSEKRKTAKALEKAEHSFVREHNRRLPKGENKLTDEAFHDACVDANFAEPAGLTKHTRPKFELVVEAREAVAKVEATLIGKGTKAGLRTKLADKTAELKDLKAKISATKNGNNSNVVADLRAKRAEARDNVNSLQTLLFGA